MQLAQKLLATRGGTITVGGFAALLAALVLLLYLSQYRSSVDNASEPVPVLVAKTLIEKGTPGDVVGLKELFQTTESPKDQLKEGAITDPTTLRGRVAAVDVYPGSQLTTGDFASTGKSTIGTTITGNQRAISIPLDSAHGMVGQLQAGDHVDVYAGFNVNSAAGATSRPVLKVIMQDVVVLQTPHAARTGAAAGANTSNIVLRTSYEEAAQLAWSIDNGKVWIVLRPRTGAPAKRPGIVTPEALLLGVRPITVNPRRVVGGRQ
ncbi:MAG TPA: Flp pilus assembly protein CpaB [Gaiellaceae bacterium]|jgi:Flp pilus assembly protein CpaB|nr:Flp pilus assembly protein CpaB [Gaiellaceae bacterium]